MFLRLIPSQFPYTKYTIVFRIGQPSVRKPAPQMGPQLMLIYWEPTMFRSPFHQIGYQRLGFGLVPGAGLLPHAGVEEVGGRERGAVGHLIDLRLRNWHGRAVLGIVEHGFFSGLEPCGTEFPAAAGKFPHHRHVVELEIELEHLQRGQALVGAVEAAAVGGENNAQGLELILIDGTGIGAPVARTPPLELPWHLHPALGRRSHRLLGVGLGAAFHGFGGLFLQAAVGAQREMPADCLQGVACHDRTAQADHVVVVKVDQGLDRVDVHGVLHPDGGDLPFVCLKALLEPPGDLLRVLRHGGIEDQGSSLLCHSWLLSDSPGGRASGGRGISAGDNGHRHPA